jgi:hypothetical protein
MKSLYLLSILAALSVPAFAASGEATCAKCDLKVAEKCQLALKVAGADGKTETILADQNTVSKDFHSEICKATKKVTYEGKVTEKDGKKTIELTKIEVAK